jgi:hypothetical protein
MRWVSGWWKNNGGKEYLDILKWIESWFSDNCDGDWEHGYGIRIETLDNPGWMIHVYLEGTSLEDVMFDEINDINRSESNNWIQCKVENNIFKGYGGPMNIDEILNIFRKWVEANDYSREHSYSH